MKDSDFLERNLRLVSTLVVIVCTLSFFIFGLLLYYVMDPQLTAFQPKPEKEVIVDPDRIEEGIHVRTGLIAADGFMSVVNNCTNCHSAKLVIQNRMNRERWVETIRWMQRTQNLWDLGEQEDGIIEYLVTNYPPPKQGRRAALTDIEWYELED